jgi:hypothetical protein
LSFSDYPAYVSWHREFTFEQIRAVTQTVKTIGGFARLNDLLGLIKEVGGLKKFKDLLEAMSLPETDAIPF